MFPKYSFSICSNSNSCFYHSGSLLTRSLGDIVKKEDFVLNSEYLTTLLVVVPRWVTLSDGPNDDNRQRPVQRTRVGWRDSGVTQTHLSHPNPNWVTSTQLESPNSTWVTQLNLSHPTQFESPNSTWVTPTQLAEHHRNSRSKSNHNWATLEITQQGDF